VRTLLCAFGLLLLASAASAHSSSHGKARFDVLATGVVHITLELMEQDLLDLVDVDLSSAAEKKRAEEGLLSGRLATSFPRWLRLDGDDEGCPIAFTSWEGYPPRGVRLTGEARCLAQPEQLTVHWGLSAASPLDIMAVTAITAPGGLGHTTVLSRRAPKVTVLVKRPSALQTARGFLASGVEHILLGWDHLAFLLALLLSCARWRRLVLVATAFTLAHSLTLALGALEVLRVSSQLVEPVIAASIAVAAGVSLLRLLGGTLSTPGSRKPAPPPVVELALVLGFGLVHGLGFAGELRDALADAGALALPLLSFNLGVELGQLIAVVMVFPALLALGRWRHGPRVFAALLFGLVALGSFVTLARLL
jgi:hydrogenase/urease accessory protein HupE